MEAVNLSLYLTQKPTFNFQPSEVSHVNPYINASNPQSSTESVINSIFPNQAEEDKITRTRRYLGETAKILSDEQIERTTTEFQFLIDSWLDEYEKEIFSGKTLKEVLNNE